MQLIVRIPRRDGSVRESQHDGAATVGRAPANDVVLSGLRVAAQHLRLTALAADRLGVECLSSIGVRLNDGPMVTGAFEARVGDSLEVGSWRLTVQAAESGDALRVLATDIGNADGLQRSRLSLGDTGLRMRRPALIGAVAVLLLALLLPLLFRPRWPACCRPSGCGHPGRSATPTATCRTAATAVTTRCSWRCATAAA